MSEPCALHIVSNCKLCAKQSPAAALPIVSVSPTVPISGTNVPIPSTPSPYIPSPAAISDPHASKVLAAANKYASECDNYKAISDEVKNLETKMLDAKKRLASAATNRDTAHAEMVKLMGEKA